MFPAVRWGQRSLSITLLFPPYSLIFLPFLSFPIGWGVSGMVALDMLGAARGWALFDHYAHLGGAAFGLAYFQWGQLVWENAKRVAAGKKEVKG